MGNLIERSAVPISLGAFALVLVWLVWLLARGEVNKRFDDVGLSPATGWVYAVGSTSSKRDVRNVRLMRGLIVVAWLYGFVTAYLRVSGGRVSRILVRTDAPVTGAAKVSVAFFLLAFLLIALVIIMNNVFLSSKQLSVHAALVPLVPFVAVVLSGAANGVQFRVDTPLYVLAVFAVWRARVPFSALSIIGWLTVLAALVSIFMGVANVDIGTIPAPITGEKATWPTLLAGPYGHSNVLGLGLSMGLPFIFLIKYRLVVVPGVALTLFAIGWSGNRNSILAAVIALVILAIVKIAPRSRLPLLILTGIGVLFTVVVPCVTSGLGSYSDRGRIWISSLSAWRERPIFGWGFDYYNQLAQHVSAAGETAFNGHNILVHSLATGGILLAAGVAAFIGLTLKAAWNLVPSHSRGIAVAFAIILIYNGWLQNTTNYVGVHELAYATWLPMAVILSDRAGGRGPKGQPLIGPKSPRLATASIH